MYGRLSGGLTVGAVTPFVGVHFLWMIVALATIVTLVMALGRLVPKAER